MSLRAALAAPALALTALAPGAGAQQSDLARLGPGRVAGQVALGVLATPVGFVLGGMLTEGVAEAFGADDPKASRIALVGGWTGAALATGGASALIGARGPGRGSYPAAVGGAVAGGLVSLLLVRIFDRDAEERKPPCRLVCSLAAGAVFVLPSAGAAVGYGASRRR